MSEEQQLLLCDLNRDLVLRSLLCVRLSLLLQTQRRFRSQVCADELQHASPRVHKASEGDGAGWVCAWGRREARNAP